MTTDIQYQLLATLLVYPEHIQEAHEVIGDKRVFRHDLQLIYGKMVELWDKKEHIDSLIILNSVPQKLQPLVNELIGILPSPQSVSAYVRLLVEEFIKKSIGEFGTEIAYRAQKTDADAFELLEMTETRVFKLSSSVARKNFASPESAAKQAMDYIEKASLTGVSGLKTGIMSFDDLTGGFQDTDLIILAARPSVGKTAFAVDLADYIATTQGAVGFFSLEMSTRQLMTRLIAHHTGINGHKLRLGLLSQKELGLAKEVSLELAKTPIFIEDTGGIHIGELKAKARKIKLEKDIRVLMVDYLQLVTTGKKDSREQEVSSISRALKSLAKELNIPIICLSQLSRLIEQREEKLPRLSDLRESGAIEQDADIVMFIHSVGAQDDERKILIAKQRNGPTGEITLRFNAGCSKFTEVV